MTDEEKAEKYAEDYKTKDGRSLDYCDIKQAHLDGLAEGRKAEADKIFDEWCSGSHDEPQECGFLKQLKKENAELINSVLEFSNSVIELTNAKTELENKVTELEKQIEKMKRCGNCKHDRYRICVSEIRCENFEQWELAE